jgi:transcriptional regulator with XRE-family HTH domain
MKKELPPLCLAVKRFREYLGESQEAFGRRIGVALMTVSRFETGRAEPRDLRVLKNLASAVSQRITMLEGGPLPDDFNPDLTIAEFSSPMDPELSATFAMLESCQNLFLDAVQDAERTKEPDFAAQARPNMGSLREWRLLSITRVAALYFPEEAAAIEKVAPKARVLVDEVLSKADENQIDYARFDREVFALAERRALQAVKQGKKDK